MITYSKQNICSRDIKSVVKVLKSPYLTQGPEVPKFEKKVQDYCKVKYAIACNSATSALHIACKSLSLSKKDILWTSPNTFVASANCALHCGAQVDFVDIDPFSYNICIKKLEKKLQQAKKKKTLPKILVVVHMAGLSPDIRSIKLLSKKYKFKIIEDASHALGGKYLGGKIGNCLFSDMTIFSFHPVKIITSGEGGVVTTNNYQLSRKLMLYRSHGITSDPKKMENTPKNEIWNYQMIALGNNYRMTDIQASLGLSQMRKLNAFVRERNVLAKNYNLLLKDLPVQLPISLKNSYSTFHLYIIRIKNQKKIFNLFRKKNVLVNLHYIPVYRQPYYAKMGFKIGYCPESEKYFKEAISIPIYPGLKYSEQKYIANIIKKNV